VQRGTISYSDVPHKPSYVAPLQAPAVAAANLLITAWLFLPWRTARVRWMRPLAEVTQSARESGRPIIYYSWHAYEPFLLLAFRDVAPQLIPRAIGHDGFTSRLLQRAVAAYGFPVWVYRRRSPVPPKTQIIRMLERDGPIASLVADAGGTPRVVRPGFAEVVRSVEAYLVPIVVRVRLRLRVSRPWRYGLPLPFSRVDVLVGDPLDGRVATPESCRDALEDLG
jgi:lysophospholipid acyltransferase (LPLAT)-like uncharacterized protein